MFYQVKLHPMAMGAIN